MSHNALRLFPSPNPRSDWFGKTRTGRYSLRVQARGTVRYREMGYVLYGHPDTSTSTREDVFAQDGDHFAG